MDYDLASAGTNGAPRTACLADPVLNRGTAYTEAERDRLGIEGLLPPRVETLAEQAARVIANVRLRADPLEQYVYLASIQSENETLYFHVLDEHLAELLPVVYTPTVGDACQQWSRIYTRPRGIYLSTRHRGRIERVLSHWPQGDPAVIVVTDGGRILGLGDLGANGMGIPIGKLALYTACAGVPPGRCLPVTIDVGTDNDALRDDPLYLGLRERRLTGAAYDALLEEFVTAVAARFPGTILQFEDFNNDCAFRLLARYRDRLCCFNDDVQGTGAMGLAGLVAATRLTGQSIGDQRILFVGAGEAGLGMGRTVLAAMQANGLSPAAARSRCLFVDSRGLVVAGRSDLAAHKREFAQDLPSGRDLLAAVEAFRPTVLVGACGQPGAFTQPLLAALARFNERPVVFALSNPTSRAECTAQQAYEWTGGRAVFASGSPSAPVTIAGRTHTPGQGNNAFVFPGVGLGLLLAGACRVSDGMLLAAAAALADRVTPEDLASGRVFPQTRRMREIAIAVAAAVADVAHDEGLATRARPEDTQAAAARIMYRPGYG